MVQRPEPMERLGFAGFAFRRTRAGRQRSHQPCQSLKPRTAQRSKPEARVKAIKPSQSLETLNGGAIKGGGGLTLKKVAVDSYPKSHKANYHRFEYGLDVGQPARPRGLISLLWEIVLTSSPKVNPDKVEKAILMLGKLRNHQLGRKERECLITKRVTRNFSSYQVRLRSRETGKDRLN